LFEQLAQENIATLDRYQVKTIVTSCPHCFNTFRNEYPQYGGKYEVYHHSEYLARLVREGKLSVDMPTDKKVTFHDPCYLGRQQRRLRRSARAGTDSIGSAPSRWPKVAATDSVGGAGAE